MVTKGELFAMLEQVDDDASVAPTSVRSQCVGSAQV